MFGPLENHAAIIVGRAGEYEGIGLAHALAFAQTVAKLGRHYGLPLVIGITNPLIDGEVNGDIAVGILAAHVREVSSWERGNATFRARDVFQYDAGMVPEHLYTVAQMNGVVFKPRPLTGRLLCPVGWSAASLYVGKSKRWAIACTGEDTCKVEKISASLRASILRAGSLRFESEYI